MSAIVRNFKNSAAIYLYGNGSFGQDFHKILTSIGFRNLKGFLDTFRTEIAGVPLPTYQVDEYLQTVRSPDDTIIVTSSFKVQIMQELENREINSNIFGVTEFISSYIGGNIHEDIDIFKNGNLPRNCFSGLVKHFISNVLGWSHDSVFWGDRLITLDKSNGFLSDDKFRRAFEAVRGAHAYDQYDGAHTISHRLNTLVWAARNALYLEGDFVECGVFKGDMSWVVVNATDFLSSGKNFYLYDSFEGFSEKYSSPADFPENPSFFDMAQNVYQCDMYENAASRFSNLPSIKLVRGFLPEALDIECPNKISYLHIDLNSPTAEIGVLDVLFDRVVPGGYIVFDDYGWSLFHRQKEVEDEFMQKRGYHVLELPTGQGLVIKR